MHLAVRPAILVLLAVSAVSLRAQSSTLVLENQLVRISVFANNGTLNEIIHKGSGVNLRSRTNGASRQLWTLRLASTNGSTVQFGPSSASSFTGRVLTNSTGATLDLTWQGIQLTNPPSMSNGVIHATITLPAGESTSVWRWEATNLNGAVIQNVIYPNISGIGPISGTNDLFIAPRLDGRVYRNPASAKVSFTGIYPSTPMNMQFVAFSSPTVTFALRAEDTSGYSKSFRFNQTTSTAGDYAMSVWHDFDLLPVDRATIPYDVVLTAFVGANGDWTDAAEDYKKWACKQWWVQQAGTRATPEWLLNTGACKEVCGMGHDNLVPQTYRQNVSLLAQDQERLGVPLLAMLWGWEKYGVWFYGDYFPPQEGWDYFDDGISLGQQQGTRWWAFLSPNYMTTSTALWQSGRLQPAANLDENGNLILEHFEPGREYVWMDHFTPAWQAEIIAGCALLAQHGVDLIQLDGFPQQPPPACFDAAHGHPLGGGGDWQSQAWFRLLAAVRSSVQTMRREAALSGEGGAEIYLPWLDLYHSRDAIFERYLSNDSQAGWEVIPLFEYVYHPWEVMVGQIFALINSYSPEYERIGLGRTLVWGQIPGYYYYPPDSGKPPVNQTALDFVGKIARARTTFAKKFVVKGSMLPPPAIQCPPFTATYPLRESTNNATATRDFPAVPAGAWRASDGTVGIVLANLATNAVQFHLPVDFRRLSLDTNRLYKARFLCEAGATALLPASGPLTTYNLSLDPLDVGLVELTGALLDISLTNGQATIYWPLTTDHFVLNETETLSPPNWQPVAQTPTSNGTTLCVTLPIAAANKFFRLVGP